MNKNVVEAYIDYFKQLIILVSGLSGSGKSELGKNISIDFKIKHINARDYYNKDYHVTTVLPNGETVVNWYTDDAVNWVKLNEDINNNKDKGVIITNDVFPRSKLTFTPDVHINLKLSKNNLLQKRADYIQQHGNVDQKKIMGTETEKLILNQLTYPYYLETIKNSDINSYLDVNDLVDDEIYDKAFDIIIGIITNKLKKENVTTDNPFITQNDIQSEHDNIAFPIYTDSSSTSSDELSSSSVSD